MVCHLNYCFYFESYIHSSFNTESLLIMFVVAFTTSTTASKVYKCYLFQHHCLRTPPF